MAARKFQPSLITPVLTAFAVIGSLQTPVQGQTVEYWNTSEGELQLTDKGAHNYSGTFNGNKLYGTRSNRGNFIGHWINNKRDTPRCLYPINGSYYWGPVQLNFSTNRFNGKFGVCDYPPGANWTGSLKMTGGGNSGLDMTGFFNPDYSKTYVTNLGSLKFRKANGSYATGEYGNDYGTIQITSSYWRPSPRQEREIHGTFRNREGGKGEFVFNFESACTFQGEWWFQGQERNKQPWRGICSSGKPRPRGGWSCKAMTAGCSAQAAGLLVEEYCVKNPTAIGCPFKQRR